MTITYCDRCKSEIPEQQLQMVKTRVELGDTEYDLCPECQKKLFKFISFNYIFETTSIAADVADVAATTATVNS